MEAHAALRALSDSVWRAGGAVSVYPLRVVMQVQVAGLRVACVYSPEGEETRGALHRRRRWSIVMTRKPSSWRVETTPGRPALVMLDHHATPVTNRVGTTTTARARWT